MMMRALVLAMLVAASQPAFAQSPSIRVDTPWARSTPPAAKTAAAYMTLVNTGTEPDRLVSASTPVAGEAEVHRSSNENGVIKMSPAGAIELPPGAPVVLSPGTLHLMMMDLKAPLVDGRDFPLTLVFEKAGKVEVAVHVQRTPPAAAATSGPVILSPSNGATVSSPVTVIVDARSASAMPAAAGHMHGAAGEGGHLHLVIDSPLPKAGTMVPVDDRHIHLMGGETKTTLNLAPGQHTLQVIQGGMDHKISRDAPQSTKVTITVR